MTNLGIIGTTTWGTTLAIINAREGRRSTLLARSSDEAHLLIEDGENRRFVPGISFPEGVSITDSPDQALSDADIVIFAVPSSTLRENARQVAASINPHSVVISAVKGLETGSGKRMTQVLLEELSGVGAARICALSGPNLAGEIVQGKPSSTVVASISELSCKKSQVALNSSHLRVYTNSDLIGVEIAGALKNVTAIAVGISDGLGYGNNAKASLITRGLAEISRLGSSLGAEKMTFSGLAGMGDLIATCSSSLSRNNKVGRMLAEGKTLTNIEKSMDNIAEGIGTTKAVTSMAERLGIHMPLAQSVHNVLFEGMSPRAAVAALMDRTPTSER
ncbi:MAG: NAD(P)H-dependent glycerol-3-phosphate dehydrogenase [Chloroflexota bacterium]|nr:NAD(P)H-dependent glycerol-3-phosphate dehydrogenase [Chloroflexota bacterium]